MPTTDPVVVPVQLDLSQAQTALGVAGRRADARGARSTQAQSATDWRPHRREAGSSRLLREIQALETSVGRVVLMFDRLYRWDHRRRTGSAVHHILPPGTLAAVVAAAVVGPAARARALRRAAHPRDDRAGFWRGRRRLGTGVVNTVGRWYTRAQLADPTLLLCSWRRRREMYHQLEGTGGSARRRPRCSVAVSPQDRARMFAAMARRRRMDRQSAASRSGCRPRSACSPAGDPRRLAHRRLLALSERSGATSRHARVARACCGRVGRGDGAPVRHRHGIAARPVRARAKETSIGAVQGLLSAVPGGAAPVRRRGSSSRRSSAWLGGMEEPAATTCGSSRAGTQARKGYNAPHVESVARGRVRRHAVRRRELGRARPRTRCRAAAGSRSRR
jgi:hypothetical protein